MTLVLLLGMFLSLALSPNVAGSGIDGLCGASECLFVERLLVLSAGTYTTVGGEKRDATRNMRAVHVAELP